MDYEKAYNDALERAKDCHVNKKFSELDNNAQELCEYIFPELRESEDERIRKAIYNCVKWFGFDSHYFKNVSQEECLAWLEKQGEPQPYKGNGDTMRKNLIRAFKSVGGKYWGGLTVRDILHFLESKDAIELEKQGEQNVGKIEPKFKVCDWVVHDMSDGRKDIRQIIGMTNKTYILDCEYFNTFYFNDLENDYHLWTIQDAKDGDVLATEYFIFIFKNIDKDNDVHYYCHYEIYKHENDNQFDIALPQSLMGEVGNSYYSPATKEQRDLLFQKMKEAGYEWDADEKVLVMIGIDNDEEDEQYEELMEDTETDLSIKQNPAWSEEDEKIIETMCKEGDLRPSQMIWLKSLKNRVQPHWKPTEEQLMALRDAIDNNEMESLYNDLKKL